MQLNTLQDALQAQEAKTMELTEVKEAFDGLSLELESSGKRIKELEDELQCSAGELEKFEDLHKQSGSHAELETKKALEFERLLEVAKLSAKEVEHQMASLQELKGLCDKIAESQNVEEALKTMQQSFLPFKRNWCFQSPKCWMQSRDFLQKKLL